MTTTPFFKNLKDFEQFVKICRKNKVGHAKINGAEIVFLDQTNPPSVILNKVQKKRLEEITERNNLKDNADFSDEQIENMHIEDPVGYENAIVEGELESGGREDH